MALSFGEDLAEGLAELRELAESRMRGSCRIVRPGKIQNGTDGKPYVPASIVYSGKYYGRYPGLAFEQTPEIVGATAIVSRLVIRIPFGAICRPNDVVLIDADPDNPQLAGTFLRVASIDDQSQATAQRLITDDYQGGVQLVITDEGVGP